MIQIIDVSTWQENMNYAQLKASGVDGIIIRAGFSYTLDNEFYNHMNGALNADFKYIGAYWFGYAGSADEARAEANRCDQILAPYKDRLNLGVYYDWEYDSENRVKARGITPTKTLVTSMNKAFCDVIASRGYAAGYYLNLDYASRLVDESQLTQYRRWLAMWPNVTVPTLANLGSEDCFLWQCKDNARFNGYNGNLDLNYLLKDVQPEPQPEPQPQPQPEPTPEPDPTPTPPPKNHPDKPNPEPIPVEDWKNAPLTYRTYVQWFGWLPWVKPGTTSGTQGQKLRIECLQIDGKGLDLQYRVHQQKVGDSEWVKNGEKAGVQGKELRIEAFEIKCNKKIKYRAYCQDIGWTDWAESGWVGTRGKSLRLEAIQVELA